MTVCPDVHLGFVVPSLTRATETFGRLFQVSFRPPQLVEFRHFRPDGASYFQTTYATYSNEGPVYIELIESGGRGVLEGSKSAGQFHHLGLVSPHPLHELRHARAGEAEPEEALYAGDRLASVFLMSAATRGLRLEYGDGVERVEAVPRGAIA